MDNEFKKLGGQMAAVVVMGFKFGGVSDKFDDFAKSLMPKDMIPLYDMAISDRLRLIPHSDEK